MPNYSNLTFPKPLKGKELTEVLERIHNGEKDLIEVLVTHNLRIVSKIVSSYNNVPVDSDDLFQAGCIGLMKAAHAYDHSKKIKFLTFAATCIHNEIKMELRRSRKYAYDLSLNAPRAVDEQGHELTLENLIEDLTPEPVETIAEKEEVFEKKRIIAEFMKHTDDLNKKIWTRTMNGIKNVYIANELNCCRTWVSRLKNRDIIDMKKMLEHYTLSGEVKFFKGKVRDMYKQAQ